MHKKDEDNIRIEPKIPASVESQITVSIEPKIPVTVEKKILESVYEKSRLVQICWIYWNIANNC